ncbi:MAG: quinate 5-dehydrogenase [Spirochaetes bacterium]|nr:quinate 5-dehydrogenase [Spirochaetota bacterium]
MKHAVSVSLGSSTRDKSVTVRLLDEDILLERRGSDGDEERARAMFAELDGTVDALGVGGVELCVSMPWKDYPLRSGVNLVRDVSRTPYTDGHHLKNVFESRVMAFVDERLRGKIPNRKAFLVEAVTRWGMTRSFLQAGYECVFGDLMFALGIPLPIRTIRGLERAARILLPVVSRLPISMLYSTGGDQEKNIPKYEAFYREASIVAGDWLYIRKHMPEDMDGKVIVTNTTTEDDVAFMRKRGVRWLVTTTPVLDGRSFGTNAFEAALVAAAGMGRVLEDAELEAFIDRAGIEPTIRELS